MNDFIQAQSISFSYHVEEGQAPVNVFENLSVDIHQGEMTAVLGHNVPCDIVVRTAGDSGVNCKGCTAYLHISADKTDAKRILSPFCCLRICGGIERTIWLFVII